MKIKICPFLTTYISTSTGHFLLWTWMQMSLLWTTLAPLLVHIVIERPPKLIMIYWCGFFITLLFPRLIFFSKLRVLLQKTGKPREEAKDKPKVALISKLVYIKKPCPSGFLKDKSVSRINKRIPDLKLITK